MTTTSGGTQYRLCLLEVGKGWMNWQARDDREAQRPGTMSDS